MSIERRRSPRIAILGRVHGHVASLDVRVAVREMSLGGMSIETHFPFPAGAIHEFQLTLGDGSFVHLKGTVRYSKEVTPPVDPPIFVTGIQFIDDEDTEGAGVDGLIDKIK